jgi:hypothetical protein
VQKEPERGCVFTVDLPRLPVPVVAMVVVSKLHTAKRTAARQAVHPTLPGSGALL